MDEQDMHDAYSYEEPKPQPKHDKNAEKQEKKKQKAKKKKEKQINQVSEETPQKQKPNFDLELKEFEKRLESNRALEKKVKINFSPEYLQKLKLQIQKV